MLFNVPLVTTAQYLTDAQHTLVLSVIWMGLALLASAAISMVVAVAALIWTARVATAPGDPSQRDHRDPVVRRLEREGINRLLSGRARWE
jgi:uncharacterized iron-regulated membrane protein